MRPPPEIPEHPPKGSAENDTAPLLPETSDQVPETIVCGGCRRRMPAKNKFCPHCGRGVAETAAYRKDLARRVSVQKDVLRSWSDIYQIALFYCVLLGLNFVAAYFVPEDLVWGLLASDFVLISVTTFWIFRHFEQIRSELISRVSALLLMGVLLGGAVTAAMAIFNNHLADWLLGLSELMEKTEGTQSFFSVEVPTVVLIFSICIVPGIFEELFFRGMVQGRLERHLSRREAWVVQAVVFAIAHVNLVGFFSYLVPMGLYLGWLRNRTGSLIPGMLAHFSHNLVVTLVELYHPFGIT